MEIVVCAYCRTPLGDRTECMNCGGSTARDPGIEMSEAEYSTAPRRPCPHCSTPIMTSATVCFVCRGAAGDGESGLPVRQPMVLRDVAGSYYLIPVGAPILPGRLEVRAGSGNVLMADSAAIAVHQVTPEAAAAELERRLQCVLDDAQEAYCNLGGFRALREDRDAQVAAREAARVFELLAAALLRARDVTPERAKAAIRALQGLSEDAAAAGVPQELAALFDTSEQNALLQSVMTRLRDIAGKLDAGVLEHNDNPEAWVGVLYRELFADELESRSQQAGERIRSTVTQSIADGLRQRGILPSADFDARRRETD